MEVFSPVKNQKRSGIAVLLDVVHALTMRELKTRFGASKLGYFWALMEPIAQILLFVVLFSFRGKSEVEGIAIPSFILTGILPWLLFQNTLKKVMLGVKSNKALFGYRQVKPIDTLITRALIELLVFIAVYCVLIGLFAWLGYQVSPQNFLQIASCYLLLFIIAFALGICTCVAVEFSPEVEKVVNIALRPMFFISGIFFTITMLPTDAWSYLSWNPVLHAIELGRSGYFASYDTRFGSFSVLALQAISFMALALFLYRINRFRLSSQ